MTQPKNDSKKSLVGSLFPTAEEFSSILGQVSWLMTMSKEHKNLPISTMDTRILPSIVLKQFKLLTKNKTPVAFVAWATVSDEVKQKFDVTDTLEFADWRTGTNLVVVECVSPFGSAEILKKQFIEKFQKSEIGSNDRKPD